MARYVWKNGEFVDPNTNEPMTLPYAGQITRPFIVSDTPAYTSPITGEVIEGRAARREDLKKHGCIEAGDMKRLNDGRVRNEKFARKHGLKWAGD
jgi:hypothetical protein